MLIATAVWAAPWGFEGAGDGADDAPFRPLPALLADADEVVLGETVALSEDGRRLTIRILRTARDRLCAGRELTLPHPRLATPDGFVRFVPDSRYVYVLFRGEDETWRTVELGAAATFPVRDDIVRVPAFYEPGVVLPAEGPPLEIPTDAFFGLLDLCREGDESKCRKGFEELIAAGRRASNAGGRGQSR